MQFNFLKLGKYFVSPSLSRSWLTIVDLSIFFIILSISYRIFTSLSLTWTTFAFSTSSSTRSFSMARYFSSNSVFKCSTWAAELQLQIGLKFVGSTCTHSAGFTKPPTVGVLGTGFTALFVGRFEVEEAIGRDEPADETVVRELLVVAVSFDRGIVTVGAVLATATLKRGFAAEAGLALDTAEIRLGAEEFCLVARIVGAIFFSGDWAAGCSIFLLFCEDEGCTVGGFGCRACVFDGSIVLGVVATEARADECAAVPLTVASSLSVVRIRIK